MTAAARFVIAGAEDAVGGRLLERLALEGAAVRAVVRHPAHALRPCRFGIDVVAVDPGDAAAMAAAVEGSEVVFACDDDRAHPELMVEAARHLTAACEAAGVRRLVAVSSAVVYEPLPPEGVVDETRPRLHVGEPYHDALVEREEVLLAAGLPVLVLQPGVLYGPHTPATDQAAERLRWQRPVVTGGGAGTCNAVYIDDVVDAVLAAAGSPEACGRALLTGPEPITWREFFDAHAGAIGAAPPRYVADGHRDGSEPPGSRPRLEHLRPLALDAARELRRRTRPLTKRVAKRLGHQATVTLKRSVKRRLPRPPLLPDAAEEARYRSRAVLSADRARSALGWVPRYGFEEGMNLTAAYLRWAYP